VPKQITYANVMATIAVFIALGGSSYAAVTLSKNSVRSKHIKNGQVKRADLGGSAVDSAKVKDGTLLTQDFKPGQLVAGAPGPAGAQGAKGDTGPKGDTGTKGDTGNTGPRGPSNAFGARTTSGGVLDNGAFIGFAVPGFTLVQTLTLEPGNYMLVGKVNLDTTSAASWAIRCFISGPGLTGDTGTASLGSSSERTTESVTTTTVGTLTGTAVSLTCLKPYRSSNNTDAVNWSQAALSAVRVDAATMTGS